MVNVTAPALPPPLGICSNFENPESQSYVTVVPCAVIVGIMIILVFTRMYTKVYILNSVGWDDCTLATAFSRFSLVLTHPRYMYLRCSMTVVVNHRLESSHGLLVILFSVSRLLDGV